MIILEPRLIVRLLDDHANTHHSNSTGHVDYGSPGNGTRGTADISMVPIGLPTPQTTQEPTDVDGLATVSSLDEGDCLYGASSTIALTRFFRVKAAENQGGPIDPGASISDVSLTAPERRSQGHIPEITHEEDVGAALFPSRPMADDFVSCFWEFVHPLFPVLHKTSFMQRYHNLWTEQAANPQKDPATTADDAIFTSTLNIIFALGCQFSTLVPAQRCTTLAQEFYQRARKLYNYEIMDSMSIPLVQKLLLTGVYLQSAQNPNRCWNVIGLAIRVAQGMGLHVERPWSSRQTQLDREMRRRIWHCCLVLDR